ncbi:MAG: membrane dipeptidase, partial [Candidatus Bathyarchaeota archaeon]
MRGHRQGQEGGQDAVIFGPQDSQFLEGKTRFLDIAHMMGVRIIQLSYSWRNFAADGCWEPRDGGLSNYGFELVDAMNKKGVLIDLS